MYRSLRALIASSFVISAAQASTKQFIFQANGTVASVYSADRDFRQVANPPSTIKAGDAFSVMFFLEPTTAFPTTFYADDPSINIYYHYVTKLVMRAGPAFVTSPNQGEQTFATFQLWDNRHIGASVTDAFTLSTLRYLPTDTSPVDLGEGRINSQFHYSAYDSTGTARASDALTELPPLDRYSSRSGFFGFLNGDTYLQSTFQVRFSTASLSAVPEPSTWAFLIVGFGMVGAVSRRRHPAPISG